jgi:Flp pilus assembly protein TadD
MAMHRTGLLRSSELCGACHQKNWGLAQNGRRWLPGPDEFHEWQESRFSGQSLFVAGPEEARGCTGCHDPHGGAPPSRPPAVAVELFLRGTESDGRPSLTRAESAPVALQTWRLRPRQPLLLEVVVANEGVGHDFPAGMPDLRETWLEVEVLDSAGKPVLENGRAAADTELSPATFVFRLDARDAGGKPITHGDLDRMDSLASWRRISPGGAVLARYALRVPEAGVGGIRARLRRRVRPAFRRWCAGLGDEQRVLAERTVVRGRTVAPDSVAWRRYGVALMGEKAYPFALAALRHSIYFGPGGPEADLILGQIHLEEGNLMAARQQFGRLAETGLDRARAWEGAVLRRMGLYSEATHRLAPLSRRYPRDRRLRFELGLTFLAQLRNEAALREFDAMLAVDPTDPAAHYNRMLCLQRLNDLPGVRREEALYKLLAAPEGGRAPAGTVPLAGRTPAGTAPMPLEPPGPPLTPIASPATEYAPRLGGPR